MDRLLSELTDWLIHNHAVYGDPEIWRRVSCKACVYLYDHVDRTSGRVSVCRVPFLRKPFDTVILTRQRNKYCDKQSY